MTLLTAVDDDLFMVREIQLETLERMQLESSRYVWRVVENVGFLSGGGQRWERQVQLRLPAPPPIKPHKEVLETETDFIVSLGTFRRRRFADFLVTANNGRQCHLLTRRQHGFCLASLLLNRLFYRDEWEAGMDRKILRELHEYLSLMITNMSWAAGNASAHAESLLVKLFESLGVTDELRIEGARETLGKSCESLLAQTQYLCWVTAKPGDTVYLSATYTQADTPYFFEEVNPESKVSLRTWWRNLRTKVYADCNVFPLRQSFAVPAYGDCKSYYFTIEPPPETRIVLLDWGTGRRYDATNDAHDAAGGQFDGIAGELDCAAFSYHFHNAHGNASGSGPAAISALVPTRLHAFFRPESNENGKLAAVGALSVVLAILAERGALFSGDSGTGSQWLLLAPAALVLFVSQQRRYHYERFTRRYRLLLWAYTGLAMIFAGSVVFDSPSIPLLSRSLNAEVSRGFSAAFAVASGILIVIAAWSGRWFEWAAQKHCENILERLRLYGTPSLAEALRKYRWRPRYWRKPTQPLAGAAARGRRHRSDAVYAATSRHGIDRALVSTALAVLAVTLAMTFHLRGWHWGFNEQCAIAEQHQRQLRTEEGKAPQPGRCRRGQWVTQAETQATTKTKTKATGHRRSAQANRA